MSLHTATECPAPLLAWLRSSLGVFAGLSDAEWNAAATALRCEHYRHGEAICAKGDPADAMFVIRHGKVEIASEGTHLQIRGEGEILGEQALIEGGRRGAAMTACGEVQLVLVPHQTFERLIGEGPFARGLLRALSGKLSQATSDRARRFANEERLFAEFSAHVSPAVRNALLADPQGYGRPRCIDGVVLISDIRDFSARASGLHPLEVAQQVGDYQNHAVDVVHRHGGLVDKFIGDAVLAVWGWPQERGDQDLMNAFNCAEALIQTAGQFSFGGEPVRIGVGLNTGPVFIGNVGSGEKRQFTVLGEVVNLAARFEAMSKTLSTPFVVGSSAYARLPQAVRESLTAFDDQAPKGSARQTVYGCDPRMRESNAEESEEAS